MPLVCPTEFPDDEGREYPATMNPSFEQVKETMLVSVLDEADRRFGRMLQRLAR